MLGAGIAHADKLKLNPECYAIDSITMPDRSVVKYKAFEAIYYVELLSHQSLNRNRIPVLGQH